MKPIYALQRTFLVQRGVPHALLCASTSSDRSFAELIVVCSNQDKDDIAWESAAGELVKNERLAGQQA